MRKFALLLFSVLVVGSARGQVLPNDSVVDGKTIGDWSAEWWKWVLAIPTNQNPMLDTTGAFALVGQPEGSVFFLGLGLNLTPGAFARSFSVPENKYLFFPVEVYEADNVDSCPPCFTVEDLRVQAAGVVDNPIELHASIDGIEVPNLLAHRAVSPVFDVFYADADNIHTFAFGHPITGLIDPMVADGYWLMIAPLPPGPHVLRFGGTLRETFFSPADVVDFIVVVPTPLQARVGELILQVQGSSLPMRRQQPLLGSLKAAKASFASGKLRRGIHELHVFQNKVQAQVARYDRVLADHLIQAAQEIMDKAAANSSEAHEKRIPELDERLSR